MALPLSAAAGVLARLGAQTRSPEPRAPRGPSAAEGLLARLGNPPQLRLGRGEEVEEPGRLGTGVEALDALLGGGLPRGRLSELVGPRSSGRTALLHSILAAATRRGEACTLVDVPDAFDPACARDAGVAPGRLLWVRPPGLVQALSAAELLLAAGGFGLVALDLAGLEAAARASRRLGLSAWVRFARRVERSPRSALLVVAGERMAGSFSSLTIVLSPSRPIWSRRAGTTPLLDGIRCRLVIARDRAGAPGRKLSLASLAAS